MKTVKKIFMVIALIILTPTIFLVAFILVADATDMNLDNISAMVEEQTETETGLQEEDGILAEGEQPGEGAEPEGGMPADGQAADGNTASGDTGDSGTANTTMPGVSTAGVTHWITTGDNSALERQLNTVPQTNNNNGGTVTTAQNAAENLPDAAAYVKALLDYVYKHDTQAAVDMKLAEDLEEAEEEYQEDLEDIFNALASLTELTEEQKAQRIELIKEVLPKTKYTVGEAKKQADGSYVVTVGYERMNMYLPTVNAYIKKAESRMKEWSRDSEAGRDVPSYTRMIEILDDDYTDCMRDALGKITYAAPANATIRLQVVDNQFEPNSEDFEKFGSLVIDTDEAMNKLATEMRNWNF